MKRIRCGVVIVPNDQHEITAVSVATNGVSIAIRSRGNGGQISRENRDPVRESRRRRGVTCPGIHGRDVGRRTADSRGRCRQIADASSCRSHDTVAWRAHSHHEAYSGRDRHNCRWAPHGAAVASTGAVVARTALSPATG